GSPLALGARHTEGAVGAAPPLPGRVSLLDARQRPDRAAHSGHARTATSFHRNDAHLNRAARRPAPFADGRGRTTRQPRAARYRRARPARRSFGAAPPSARSQGAGRAQASVIEDRRRRLARDRLFVRAPRSSRARICVLNPTASYQVGGRETRLASIPE